PLADPRHSSMPPHSGESSTSFGDPDVQMAARVEGDRIVLDVRLDPDRRSAFAGDVEMLAQLVVVASHPVVVLSLVDGTGDRPYVRRAALNPRSNHRGVLDALAKKFRADVTFHGIDGTSRTSEVSGAREKNVALLLERIDALPKGDAAIDIDTAIERA